MADRDKLEIKSGPGREVEKAGRLSTWCNTNIPEASMCHISVRQQLKKKKRRRRSDDWRDHSGKHSRITETNSRTTEMYTKKLPTFSRLRLEKKRHLFFQCVKTSLETDLGWAGRTWWRRPGKGRCQKSTIAHLLEPLWNKPSSVNEPSQELWFLPCRDWNSGTATQGNSFSADSKVWVLPDTDPDVGGYVGKSHL